MRKLLLTGAAALALAGCTRYEPVTDFSPAPAAERQSPSDTPIQTETGMQAEAEQVVKHSHKRRLLFPNSLYAQHLLELVGRSLESQ